MEDTNIIIINLHGGCPYSLLPTALKKMEHLRNLQQTSDYYTQTYNRHTLPEGSLEDLILGGNSSMFDHPWNKWSGNSDASASGFHAFKKAGYKVYMKGMFGVKHELNNRVSSIPYDMLRSLQEYGIDEFEARDASFSNEPSYLHDNKIFDDIEKLVNERKSKDKTFIMANLMAFQDAERILFSRRKKEPSRIPTFDFSQVEGHVLMSNLFETIRDSSHIPKSSTVDDPRSDSAIQSNKISGLKSSAYLHDWLTGTNNSLYTIEEITNIHRFCWTLFEYINERIGRLLKLLDNKYIVVLMADQGLSLYEHGCFRHQPWDTCLRGFIMINYPNQLEGNIIDNPKPTAFLLPTLARACGIKWPKANKTLHDCENCATTLFIAPSYLSKRELVSSSVHNFHCFFIRTKVEYLASQYTIIMWFSYMHINDPSSVLRNPIKNCIIGIPIQDLVKKGYIVQIYNTTSDPDELDDLTIRENWLTSETALQLKAISDNTNANLGFDTFKFSFPKNIEGLNLTNSSFSPFQQISLNLRRDEISSKQDAATEIKLEEIVKDKFGSNAIIQHTNIKENITVLVSLKYNNEWLPLPFHGSFFPNVLKSLGSIVDINGFIYPIQEYGSNFLLVGENCKILLKTHYQLLNISFYIATEHIRNDDINYPLNENESFASENSLNSSAISRARASNRRIRK